MAAPRAHEEREARARVQQSRVEMGGPTPRRGGAGARSCSATSGSRWRHGAGRSWATSGDTVTVFFDSVGYKTLGVDLVRAGDLLTVEA